MTVHVVSEVTRVAKQHVLLKDFIIQSFLFLFFLFFPAKLMQMTYVFERIGLVADGASFAVDALPEGGREDLPREFFRVVQTRWVNCDTKKCQVTGELITSYVICYQWWGSPCSEPGPPSSPACCSR